MRISDWSSDVCSSDLANAAGGAVPGEQDVVRPVDLGQVGKLAVIGAEDRRVELELLGGIGDPAFAEALPRQRRDRTGAEHRPHRHLNGAGDRKSVVSGKSVLVSVDLGGRRNIKKKKKSKQT